MEENINYLTSSLSLEFLSEKRNEMSAILTKTIKELDPCLPKLAVVKRLMHEILAMHYIVPASGEKLPEFINNALNGVEKYKSIQFGYEMDVIMTMNEDNTFDCVLFDLYNEDTTAICFSLHDVDCFLSNTNGSIIHREEKFDYIHLRIKNFLKGEITSKENTPMTDLDAEANLPPWLLSNSLKIENLVNGHVE